MGKNILFCSSLALARPSQEMPHRVFGTVEDTQGNAVTDADVEVVFSGETLASDTTNSDGYYDITVPYGEDYSSEEVQIQVSGSQADSFTYSSGKVEEIDLTVESSQQQDNPQEEPSPSGGGGGAFQSSENETSSNQTETDNNTTSTGNTTDGSQDTDSGSDSTDSDSEDDSSDNTEGNQTSENSGNAITGMFTEGASSIGNLVTGFIDVLASTIASLFG